LKEKVLAYMEKNHIDGFYITRPENVRYISGFTGNLKAGGHQ
jgi:Xaa-Pro aminopeptidase